MLRRRREASSAAGRYPDALGGWRGPSKTSRALRTRATGHSRTRQPGQVSWAEIDLAAAVVEID
jgi:hypothetical protein